VRECFSERWDLLIAHPPCDHLAVSGARWFPKKREQITLDSDKSLQELAKEFFMSMINAPVPRIAVENPIGIMSTEYREPDQIIDPWWFGKFGENESKATCLWLKNLSKLEKRDPLSEPHQESVWLCRPGPNRKKNRSRTFRGIADAMAEQWGNFAEPFFGEVGSTDSRLHARTRNSNRGVKP
jgi:hypothetical protein